MYGSGGGGTPGIFQSIPCELVIVSRPRLPVCWNLAVGSNRGNFANTDIHAFIQHIHQLIRAEAFNETVMVTLIDEVPTGEAAILVEEEGVVQLPYKTIFL